MTLGNPKIWCLAALLLAALGGAYAGVKASGSGANRAAALEQAKLNALAQSSGVFVIHQAETTRSGHTARTNQFAGGLITSYDVVQETRSADGRWAVEIDADIAPGKQNTVTSDRHDAGFLSQVRGVADDVQRQAAFASNLASQPVFAVEVTQLSAKASSRTLEVRAQVQITWSPKFVDDVLTYARLAGRPAQSFVNDRRGTGVCIGASGRSFPKGADCWTLGAPIGPLWQPYLLRGSLEGAGHGGQDLVVDVPLETAQLLSASSAGVFLASDGRQVQTVTFRVPTERADSVQGLTVEVVPWSPARSKRKTAG